jgi:hypothetical protein
MLLIKIMRIQEHWSTEYGTRTDPTGLHFEPLKFLNFDFNADTVPDPAFHLMRVPDLPVASKNNARHPARNNVPSYQKIFNSTGTLETE